MSRWYLTVQGLGWPAERPFFVARSRATGEHLVKLFQKKYARPDGGNLSLAVVPEDTLSAVDRTLYRDAVAQLQEDVRAAYNVMGGPLFPNDDQGGLARLHDRAERWVEHIAKDDSRSADEAKPDVDWREVRDHLLRLCDAGQKYTSQADFAKRLSCSTTTINKAIADSPKLRAWMDQHRTPSLRAQGLSAPVTDELQPTTPDPAAAAAENERLDNEFARLIQEATAEDRARLNGYDTEKRRDLARTTLEQEEDRAVQESGPERTDPAYKNSRRRGNRLLDRKP